MLTREAPRKERKCGVQQLVNARHITTIGAATPRLLPMLSRSSPPSCHSSSTLVITKMLARDVGLKVGCVAMSDTAHCVFPTLISGSARNGWCSSTRERYTRAGHNQVHSARTFRHVEYVGYRTQRFPTLTNGFCMRSTVGTRQLANVAPPPVTIKCTGCAIFVTWRDRTVFTSI